MKDSYQLAVRWKASPSGGRDNKPLSGRGRRNDDLDAQQTDTAIIERVDAVYDSLVRRIGTLNCGHSAHPIIMGVSIPQYSAAELEEMRQKNEEGITYRGKHYTGYEATQRQRNLEAAMRRQKRRILVDEAAGDEKKLQTLRQEYTRFSKAASLRTQTERAETAGFGWKQAGAADKAAKDYYAEWSKSVGVNSSIKTLAEYYDVKYNDPPRYELLKRYAADVKNGWISPLVRFDGYEALYNRVQNELVGRVIGGGTLITGQSQHFMQRVVGTMLDPGHEGVRRSGVEIESIKSAVFSPTRIDEPRVSKAGVRSVRYIGKSCVVTINPDTGVLIQTNPRKE